MNMNEIEMADKEPAVVCRQMRTMGAIGAWRENAVESWKKRRAKSVIRIEPRKQGAWRGRLARVK